MTDKYTLSEPDFVALISLQSGLDKSWSASSMQAAYAAGLEAGRKEVQKLVHNSEAIIDEYIEDYEMFGEDANGTDCCYTPNGNDKALLKDAFMGFDFLTLLAAAPEYKP